MTARHAPSGHSSPNLPPIWRKFGSLGPACCEKIALHSRDWLQPPSQPFAAKSVHLPLAMPAGCPALVRLAAQPLRRGACAETFGRSRSPGQPRLPCCRTWHRHTGGSATSIRMRPGSITGRPPALSRTAPASLSAGTVWTKGLAKPYLERAHSRRQVMEIIVLEQTNGRRRLGPLERPRCACAKLSMC